MSILEVSPGCCMRLLEKIGICVLLVMLTACSTGPFSQPDVVTKTPTPVLAGGEPVLAHSQIHIHDAPLPSKDDLLFSNGDWTLAGGNNVATRAALLPACCNGKVPAPLWFHGFGSPLLSAPVIAHNRIYLLASDGFLHVLNAQSGDEQWRIPIGGELTANGLALAHSLVYLALSGHFIAAVDANNGQVRWRFDTVGVVRAAPLVVGRVLLVASGANSLFCLDALTGEEYWAFHSEDALAEFWPTRTTPVVSDGKVYVVLGAANEFHVLNLRTGRKEWEISLHERMTGGPVLDEALGVVYIVTWSGRVVALDSHTGRLRWDYHIVGGSMSSPALSLRSGVLYLGGFNGYLYALDANSGRLDWRIPMGSAITSAPVVVRGATNDWVIVGTQSGDCMILDAHDGRQLYVWKLGELRADPVVAQGVLYQASLGDQGLFAFGL
jgi:outer membrane protein assembly factor BamB